MFKKIQSFATERFLLPLPAFLALLTLAFALTAGLRYKQIHEWQKNPQANFASGTPIMTSYDAYYWLRWAREIRDGTFISQAPDKLRNYPDGDAKPRVPAVSHLLAFVSQFTGRSVYDTGFYLVPLLSALFVFPLGLYARKMGYPLAGLVASATAGVATEYFLRTSIGRIDTDSLNLFFPLLIAYFTFLSASDRTAKALIHAALAGLAARFFHIWYEHAFFLALSLGTLILHLGLSRVRPRLIALAAVVFIVAANPVFVSSGVVDLAKRAAPSLFIAPPESIPVTAAEKTPNALANITELSKMGFEDTLELVFQKSRFSAAVLALFVALALINWRRLMPVLPLFLLGLFAFTRSRRFAMYLAPFAGLGLGFGWVLFINALIAVFDRKGTARRAPTLIAVAGGIALIILILPRTIAFHVPSPKVTGATYESLLRLKSKLPANATIWNFWNYGYLMTDVLERATYHDGAIPDSPKTVFVAASHATANERELYDIAAFVDSTGDQGINELVQKTKSLKAALRYAAIGKIPLENDALHLVYLPNMITQYGSIFELGTWDFDKGKGRQPGLTRLDCRSYQNSKLDCATLNHRGGKKRLVFDLQNGTANGSPLLSKTFLVNKGYVAKETTYAPTHGPVLEIVIEDKKISHVLLLEETAFRTTFNQMYILGRYDQTLFEEVFNEFPLVRAYRLRPDFMALTSQAPTR